MIDLLKITRKNTPNIWDVIGDKWKKVNTNHVSKTQIESFWNNNELLNAGRLNDISNLYNRICQFDNYGVLDFIIIDNLQNSINLTNELFYNLTYKILYNEIQKYSGIKVNYLFPPKIFTNTLLPANLCSELIELTPIDINLKTKSIRLAFDNKFNTIKADFTNYIFTDNNDNPFIITYFKNSIINYKPLITNTVPKLGSLKIRNKFELFQNQDFTFVEEIDSITLKFKEFKYITNIFSENTNYFSTNNSLYATNCYILDNYNLEHYGKPIGITDEDYNTLLKSNGSFLDIENKLFNLWKLNQRPYNFSQIYRLAAILSDQPYSTSISSKELIYKIDEFKIYTGKIKQVISAQILRFQDIPENLQPLFEYSSIEKDKFKIIACNDGFNNLGILTKDVILIDNQSYKLRKIFDNKYLELTEEIASGDFNRLIKILDYKTLKVYNLNTDDYDYANDITNNMYSSPSIPWGGVWGEFNWGDIVPKQLNEPKCKFKTIQLGTEYEFGDAFQKNIFIDFFSENIDTQYIQKALAITNKPFSQNNVYEYKKNRILLIDDYSINAYNYSKIGNILTEDYEPIITQDTKNLVTERTRDVLINYMNHNAVTSSDIETTKYKLNYKNLNFDDFDSYMNLPFSSDFNNTTGYCVLKGFVRCNQGSVNIGVSSTSTAFSDEYKFSNFKSSNWEYFKLYFKVKDFTTNNLFLLFKSVDINYQYANIDIFGLELLTSIPNYSEKITDSKKIINNFVNSYDYKTINLL